MSATVLAYEKQPIASRPGARESQAEPRRPILTRAETAECTCPDACERDHELD